MYLNTLAQTLNYYPLEVGNTWQYYNHSYTRHPSGGGDSYSLAYRIIYQDTIVNGKKYYSSSSGFWLRYCDVDNKLYRLLGDSEYVYMDFNLPAGETFLQVIVPDSFRTVTVRSKSVTLFNTTTEAKGFDYIDAPFFPGYNTYYEYYANNFGLIQCEYYSYNSGGYNSTNYYSVINIYMSDSTGFTYYQDQSLPNFSSISYSFLPDLNIDLKVTVKHKFSKVSVSNHMPIVHGFSYIDSLTAELYYFNGSGMIPITNYEIQVINEENYSIKIPYSRLLYGQGYNQIAYRFTTKDKAIIPRYFTYPDTGYGTIQITLSDNPDTVYYPLQVDNEWVYEKLRIMNNGDYIHDSYVKTKILKDTLINNKTYKKISSFDGSVYYERMDSFFANTYRAMFIDNEIKEIQLDSLSALLNDEFVSYRIFPDTNVKMISYSNDPGNYRKIGLVDDPLTYWELRKDKGITYFRTYRDTAGGYKGSIYQIAAARINGQAIGDTTLLTGYFNPVAAYNPLKIGNQWVYELFEVLPDNSKSSAGYFTVKVLGDTVLNDGLYYYKISISNGDTVFQRIDSLSANLFQYCPDSSKSILIDALNASIGNTINSYRLKPFNKVTHYQQELTSDFGVDSKVKYYRANEDYNCFYRLKDKLGLILYRATPDAATGRIGRTEFLKAAFIDGIVYGDSTLLNIEEEPELPVDFVLYQNYPNPFNPVTKIKFAIPTSLQTPLLAKERGRGEVVTLRVYDVLGREVTTLVNEIKAPGNYEIEWNASGLSSGVYYYQLKTGDYMEIKKMILLR
jgi:hypothetical protein